MRVDKIFIILLFVTSAVVAISSGGIKTNIPSYLIGLSLFYVFSTLYYHLRVAVKHGNTRVDYTIPYSLAIALYGGPLGVFIYESLYMTTVYFIRKRNKIADDEELLHTFYNIGSFALNGSIAYYLFHALYPFLDQIPFGFWFLIIAITMVMSFLSHVYLSIVFLAMGEMNSLKDAISFIKSRSILDMGKIAFSNGLLYFFLVNKQWEMVTGLFLLNYLVSRSNIAINQSIQHKLERDKFEQMAYTDFLTEIYNRAFMDKKMAELNNSKERLGIIVTDIDSFKLINDNYNHAVGDRAIQHFASTLRSYLSEEDYLFRSGGEEFTIFLRNRNYEECLTLVEKIREGIKDTPAMAEYENNHIHIPMTASFGLYYYRTNEAIEIKKAYVYADQLLILAKDKGKNCISAKNGLVDIPLSARFE